MRFRIYHYNESKDLVSRHMRLNMSQDDYIGLFNRTMHYINNNIGSGEYAHSYLPVMVYNLNQNKWITFGLKTRQDKLCFWYVCDIDQTGIIGLSSGNPFIHGEVANAKYVPMMLTDIIRYKQTMLS